MSSEFGEGQDDAATADPTLSESGVAAPPAAGGFPDTVAATHLVLYQTADGEIDLRWRIDAADIAHARAAFGAAEARAVLRLHRVGGNTEDRLMADADLGSDGDALDGLAHYAGADAMGSLQAEIGLAGGGGWLLVARSNTLVATAPVGAGLLREDGVADPAASGAGEQAPASAAPRPGRSPDASQSLRLGREFPLVESASSVLATPGAAAGAETERPSWAATGVHQRTATAVGDDAEGRRGAEGHTDASLNAPGQPAQAPAGEPLLPPPEPPPGGVVPRLTRSPSRRDAQQSESASRRPTPGSGTPRATADEATLTAELVVQGSAPPNTLLDLGGHRYRVGPGGRFQLRIPMREREVILRVLAALPRLPVAEREDDDFPGTAGE